MKKILFLLLLITSVSYGQAIAPTRVKITNNAISTTAPFIAAQETDGFVNKINKSDLIEVIEKDSAINLPVTGVAGKIYVTLDNNRLYRWTGTIYQDLGYVDISGKVDKVTGKSLISDAEIVRLSTISNFDNSGNVTALNNKVDKVSGKSLISDAEITRLASVSNVDISGKVDKVTGKSLILDSEITRLAGVSTVDISGKVDKVVGKSLISDTEITRLATLANYTHPTNHAPSIISQDANNRFVTDAEKTAWNAKQTALGFTAENSANKNNANGYAGLGADGKLISSQLPSITISDTFIAASQAAMLAVTAETGDVVVRTDLNKSFILKGANPAILSDWQELLTPTSAVTTVFGRNGAVTAQTGDYTATMVGAPSGSGTSTGTNTGDETLATIKTKLGVTVLSGSNTGDQTTITGNAGTATVLQTARTINGVSFNGSANITIADATKEPSFTKNTAFNTNFGNTAGTTAQGNDSRINNGQTAYAWGNHASKYPLFDGTGAYGSWGINISGNAGTATTSSNSTLWGGDSFGPSTAGNIVSMMGYNPTSARWEPKAEGAIRTFLGLGTNAYSSTAFAPLNGTGATGTWSINITGISGNSTLWNGLGWSGLSQPSPIYFLTTGGSSAGYSTLPEVKTALGLGSNAYSSTAYLPLTGGNLSGGLNGTSANFSSSVTATKSIKNISDNLTVNGLIGTYGFGPIGYGNVTSEISANFEGPNWYNGSNLIFKTSQSADITYDPSLERMRISANGNVGIGTTSAFGKLTVKEGAASLEINSDANKVQFLSFDRSAGAYKDIEFRGKDFIFSPNDVEKTRISSTGAATFSSSVTASGFFNSSDRRLKTILKRDGDVAYFKWKDGRDTKTHIGYIAQEVRKTNPDQVQKGEDKMLSVNYLEILVEKIRLLEKRITELEKQK
ncbi:MAG: hypothetical protein PHW29_05735 [Flavobacterium sp.]|nr:hypothetical protein [Flavobacterium sp.]